MLWSGAFREVITLPEYPSRESALSRAGHQTHIAPIVSLPQEIHCQEFIAGLLNTFLLLSAG